MMTRCYQPHQIDLQEEVSSGLRGIRQTLIPAKVVGIDGHLALALADFQGWIPAEAIGVKGDLALAPAQGHRRFQRCQGLIFNFKTLLLLGRHIDNFAHFL